MSSILNFIIDKNHVPWVQKIKSHVNKKVEWNVNIFKTEKMNRKVDIPETAQVFL